MRIAVGIIAGLVCASPACSGNGSGGSPSTADGGDDTSISLCTDTTGPNATAAIDDVFNNSVLACPLDANNVPLPYGTAIDVGCAALKMTKGDVQYGQCLNYLVWEVDVDSSGNNFSKCFYDVDTRALVGVVFGDGMKDQCGMTSYTIQAGSVDADCGIEGLSAAGAGGLFEDCAPEPEGGLEGGAD